MSDTSSDACSKSDNEAPGARPGQKQDGATIDANVRGKKVGIAGARQERSSGPKRRRVTRACDECRRKKIRCNGAQPCTHCSVYDYECSYDQPSNRRRTATSQYAEALRVRLARAESLLKRGLPDANIEKFLAENPITEQVSRETSIQEKASAGRAAPDSPEHSRSRSGSGSCAEQESMLESMIAGTGTLDIDNEGYGDFHGHSSGSAFLNQMRKQFHDLMGSPNSRPLSDATDAREATLGFESMPSALRSSITPTAPNTSSLPNRHCAEQLAFNALNDACVLMYFVHQPSFYIMLDRIYSTPGTSLSKHELRFLPLLYAILALGTLFATAEQSELVLNGFGNAIQQGTYWYELARSMMDIADCRDTMSLQALLCMILFLQSSARMYTCHSHIGILLCGCVRLGLHRSVSTPFNPIDREIRKRIFWSARKLDTYVGAMLGLPQLLADEDIDQEEALEVDDEFITAHEIKPMPDGQIALLAAHNYHNRLVSILAKTMRSIYPVRPGSGVNVGSKESRSCYIVSHAKIREIERDLQKWMESLPQEFKAGSQTTPELLRIQFLLRMAYAHVEITLYRPFLQHASQDINSPSFNKRSYTCAAACISVSRNIIHLSAEMRRRGMLNGAYWCHMYTTFFAVITLVFFALVNPTGSASEAVLADAYEGKDTLTQLARKSLAADRCSRKLQSLFDWLPSTKQFATNAEDEEKRMHQKNSKNSPGDSSTIPPLRSKKASSGALMEDFSAPPQSDAGSQQAPLTSSKTHSQAGREISNTLPSDAARETADMPSSSNAYSQSQSTSQILGVPDVALMMFPSTDPFAYPIQPMLAFETDQRIQSQRGDTHPLPPPSLSQRPHQEQQSQQQQQPQAMPANIQHDFYYFPTNGPVATYSQETCPGPGNIIPVPENLGGYVHSDSYPTQTQISSADPSQSASQSASFLPLSQSGAAALPASEQSECLDTYFPTHSQTGWPPLASSTQSTDRSQNQSEEQLNDQDQDQIFGENWTGWHSHI